MQRRAEYQCLDAVDKLAKIRARIWPRDLRGVTSGDYISDEQRRNRERCLRTYMFYFLALQRLDEPAHARAIAEAQGKRQILQNGIASRLEFGKLLALVAKATPTLCADHEPLHDSKVIMVPPNTDLFERRPESFDERKDKNWSLTDCISFVVMKDEDIGEALTGDKHFEQAGFMALLK